MKLAFLAGQNSIHTVRWVNAMVEKVSELHLLTMHQPKDPIDQRVKIHQLPYKAPHGYFFNLKHLKKILTNLQPDLLHVHYASGYGTLGRLTGYHPLILSVWGSDVYDFPATSFLHRTLVAANLRQADWVCSTSEVMAKQTLSICPELPNLSITPFGIDIDKFSPRSTLRDKNYLTVGTVKRLTSKYGIDILLKAFAHARTMAINYHPEIANQLRLMIVGDGSQKKELESLAKQLQIQNITNFVGAVPHEQVPHYLNQMDIYVAASRLDSESFGVAVLEASACGLPVVVSNAGGLPEVVADGVTGYIAPKENVQATAKAILQLIQNDRDRILMGLAGRKLVCDRYVWQNNVELMQQIYQKLLSKTKNISLN
ncbi:glycosyl transferase group 1 [Stanieria cyanosphaera PCC 7437]|uniref:Glycosyl transferase group 1 n=1 Tax=Stanieria cyanosphaera (strain ATCC 29371 / PCC 7437) TaxID=111780 RepID=K9XX54_STAC7|nr:glycosyltransferase [Stanieria cyanosphaera]AFZ36676.1 glycosyl transferase group 1 [Stanieria cyanosphaera PCC 7437]